MRGATWYVEAWDATGPRTSGLQRLLPLPLHEEVLLEARAGRLPQWTSATVRQHLGPLCQVVALLRVAFNQDGVPRWA